MTDMGFKPGDRVVYEPSSTWKWEPNPWTVVHVIGDSMWVKRENKDGLLDQGVVDVAKYKLETPQFVTGMYMLEGVRLHFWITDVPPLDLNTFTAEGYDPSDYVWCFKLPKPNDGKNPKLKYAGRLHRSIFETHYTLVATT